jgi:hypothetical protein
MVLEDAPVWQEPTQVNDVPVDVMQSVEAIALTPLPAEPFVESVAQPVSVQQPNPSHQPNVWAWIKHRLLGATKK